MTLLVGVLLCLGVGLIVRLARRRRQRRVLETPDRLERLRRVLGLVRGPHATYQAACAAAWATYQEACAAPTATSQAAPAAPTATSHATVQTLEGYVPPRS